MAAGKVKKEKNQILNLVGKGGEYANDTDKKELKKFLDAGGDHNFFIKEQGNNQVFKWPNPVSYTHLTLPTSGVV